MFSLQPLCTKPWWTGSFSLPGEYQLLLGLSRVGPVFSRTGDEHHVGQWQLGIRGGNAHSRRITVVVDEYVLALSGDLGWQEARVAVSAADCSFNLWHSSCLA